MWDCAICLQDVFPWIVEWNGHVSPAVLGKLRKLPTDPNFFAVNPMALSTRSNKCLSNKAICKNQGSTTCLYSPEMPLGPLKTQILKCCGEGIVGQKGLLLGSRKFPKFWKLPEQWHLWQSYLRSDLITNHHSSISTVQLRRTNSIKNNSSLYLSTKERCLFTWLAHCQFKLE